MSNDHHFAVAVGINRYPELRDLQFAKGDAEKFATWLRDADGGNLPDANVKLIVVDDDEMPGGTLREDGRPAHAEVLDAIKAFANKMEERVEDHPQDWFRSRFYLFVSGHGIAPEADDSALLTANSGPDDLGYNIPSASLIRHFQKAQTFREVVVFADCCREQLSAAPPPWIPWSEVTGDNGHVVKFFGCAADLGDLASEPTAAELDDPDSARGYYTRALLEGLGGAAAAPGEVRIDSVNLPVYLRQRVAELTKDSAIPQRATNDTNPPDIIVFRELDVDPPGFEITLRFDTFRGRAVLYDGNMNVIREEEVSSGQWKVHLPQGLYQVVDADGAEELIKEGIFKVLGEAKTIHV